MPDPQRNDHEDEATAIVQRLLKLQEKEREGAAAEGHIQAAAPPPTAKIIQLPLWPEPVRGTPNSFLRSALFAAIQGKTRRYMKNALLASRQGITVRFRGFGNNGTKSPVKRLL